MAVKQTAEKNFYYRNVLLAAAGQNLLLGRIRNERVQESENEYHTANARKTITLITSDKRKRGLNAQDIERAMTARNLHPDYWNDGKIELGTEGRRRTL